MSTLRRFSEKDRAYFEYQARQEYIREQKTIKYEREQELLEQQTINDALVQEKAQFMREKAQAQEEKAQAQAVAAKIEQEKQVALAEIIELKALLAQQNQEK